MLIILCFLFPEAFREDDEFENERDQVLKNTETVLRPHKRRKLEAVAGAQTEEQSGDYEEICYSGQVWHISHISA